MKEEMNMEREMHMKMELAAMSADQGLVEGEKVLTGNAREMGCTDTRIFHIIKEGERTNQTVLLDMALIEGAGAEDDIVIYGVQKLYVDEEGLAAYKKLEEDGEFEVLFDDPSPPRYEDYGAESAWNEYLDVQEDMARTLWPIAYTERLRLRILAFQTKVNWAKYGMDGKPGLWAKIKEADRKVQELDARLNNAKKGKSARIEYKEWNAIVKGKNEWKARAEKFCDICYRLGDRLADMWDEVHNAEDVIGSQYRWDAWKILKAFAKEVQGGFSWFYPKFLESANETISPWLTTGEVDPELDDYSIYSEQMDVGENLAWQHLRQMEREIEGFGDYSDILNPRVLRGDEVRIQRNGYVSQMEVYTQENCKALLGYNCFNLGIPKWERVLKAEEVSQKEEDDSFLDFLEGLGV